MAPWNPHALPEGEFAEAEQRAKVIGRLAQKQRCTFAEIDAAAAELGVTRAYVYRLLRLYRESPQTSTLVPARRGRRTGKGVLNQNLEAIIAQGIKEYYLTMQRPTVKGLLRHIEHECKRHCISSPSYKAVSARVKRIPAKTSVKTREGPEAARNRFKPIFGEFMSEYALKVVQIDHTRADVMVVDEVFRRPLGRPWLTLIIDIASRMVTGFYLTLEAPSAISVAMAMRHAVLPKDAWLAERGVTAPWSVSGFPDTLHMDNGKDFHSKALERGCREYGIEQQYRPPATPHYGGHIERLIGTMMGAVHLLPGTTFSNIQDKGEYDPEKTAVMTLPELETWLAIQIVGVYHASVHSSIKIPPNIAWEEAVTRRPTPLRHPADPERFLFDFLPFEYRKVRKDGIQMFNIHYWDNILSAWAGQTEARMPIKYDPRDLSRVFLLAPDGKHWAIHYRDIRLPRITLWEHREAMRLLRERGRRSVDESMIFDAIETQRALVSEAAAKTKSARKTVQRAVYALTASQTDTTVPRAIEPLPTSDDDTKTSVLPLLPYNVEEW